MDQKYNLINTNLIKKLQSDSHSLKGNPIFPATVSNVSFSEMVFMERFEDVYNKCKNVLQKDIITKSDLTALSSKILPDTIDIERKYKLKLETLAKEIITKEFDLPEDELEIIAELVNRDGIDVSRIRTTPDATVNMDFDNLDDVKNAAKEIHKRRFINALIQGSSKKLHHIFNLYDKELNAIDYRLITEYRKLMAIADLSYFTFDETTQSFPGGLVKVDVPQDDTKKIKIHARAMTFPVLLHELVKGVMEVIALRGLPQKTKLAKFVLGKADYLGAEFWDMRLGVGLWEKFVESIDGVDFHLKHHIFCDLVELPVDEFIDQMSEIIGSTAKGKRIINNIVYKIKEEIKRDDIEDSLYNLDNDDDDDIDLNNFDFTKYL